MLFACTLMVLALMVLVTLGIGMRARERVEIQMLADAAAYSNAVATARVLNSISVLNRAQVATMVAMAGNQSLISWSSYYRASLNGLQTKLKTEIDGACPGACNGDICPQAQEIADKIVIEQTRLNTTPGGTQPTKWDDLDEAAAIQSQRLQSMASGFNGDMGTMQDQLKTKYLENQKFAKELITRASQGSYWSNELSAPDAAAAVTMREAGFDSTDPTPLWGSAGEVMIQATMGSRGYSFVVDRTGAGAFLATQLTAQLALDTATQSIVVTNEGMGRFVNRKRRHDDPFSPIGAIGEDHGSVTLTIISRADPTCSWTRVSANNEAWVYSSDNVVSHEDEHTWTQTNPSVTPPSVDDQGTDLAAGPLQRHTLGECDNTPPDISCPGIWPSSIQLNPAQVVDESDHLYGEPKNYAFIKRDYTKRTSGIDPWHMAFNFKFFSSGPGGTFDNRAVTAGGYDITQQSALAAGLAYYHRSGHWQEPPNFLNPFWRATLVSADIDKQGDPIPGKRKGRKKVKPISGTDIPDTLSAGGAGTAAEEAFDALYNAGYQAWQ